VIYAVSVSGVLSDVRAAESLSEADKQGMFLK